MAQKKGRPSLKPVVKAIARTITQLRNIRTRASLAEKKKLNLKIAKLEGLNKNARKICKSKSLSL